MYHLYLFGRGRDVKFANHHRVWDGGSKHFRLLSVRNLKQNLFSLM